MQMVLTVALYAFLSTPSHGGRLPAYTDGSDPAKTPTQDASCAGKQQSADILPLSGGANCYDNNIAGGVSWD